MSHWFCYYIINNLTHISQYIIRQQNSYVKNIKEINKLSNPKINLQYNTIPRRR